MIFSNDKAIYVQIAERLSDEILAGKYKEAIKLHTLYL